MIMTQQKILLPEDVFSKMETIRNREIFAAIMALHSCVQNHKLLAGRPAMNTQLETRDRHAVSFANTKAVSSALAHTGLLSRPLMDFQPTRLLWSNVCGLGSSMSQPAPCQTDCRKLRPFTALLVSNQVRSMAQAQWLWKASWGTNASSAISIFCRLHGCLFNWVKPWRSCGSLVYQIAVRTQFGGDKGRFKEKNLFVHSLCVGGTDIGWIVGPTVWEQLRLFHYANINGK